MTDIILTFTAGAVVAWLATWRPRRRPVERRRPVTGSMVPTKVTGIYGTVHTSDGRSFTTGTPELIEIDCELFQFHLPVRADFDGELVRHTLHLGVHSTELFIDPPTRVRRGDHVTVVQPVVFDSITRGEQHVPDWTR